MANDGRSYHDPTVKPRLLDLFCCAGGCTKGYQRAGFYVVGVDIETQPNYCGDEFYKGDAVAVLEGTSPLNIDLSSFDAIHASPPCQSYSKAMKHLAHEKPMLIDAVQDRLEAIGKPWVVENVPGAPLPEQSDLFGRHGVLLCGSMFGLRVWRHRLFETSFAINAPRGCDHSEPAMNPHNQLGRDRIYEEFGKQDPDPIWNAAMGVPWMGRYEGREAIPPAYTEYIGRALLRELGLPEADRDEGARIIDLEPFRRLDRLAGVRELAAVVGQDSVDADAVGDGECAHTEHRALPAPAVKAAPAGSIEHPARDEAA